MLPIFDVAQLLPQSIKSGPNSPKLSHLVALAAFQPPQFSLFRGGNKNIVAIYDPAAADEKLPRDEKMRWLDYLETFLKR